MCQKVSPLGISLLKIAVGAGKILISGSMEDGGKPAAARQWDPQPRQRLGAGLSRDAVLQQLLLPEFLWIQRKPQH